MTWLEVAQNLPLGAKTDIECPENCGDGRKLSVHHTVKDYWCNCYRCGFTDRSSKGQQTLAELARIKELNDTVANLELKLELPDDFTNEIPRSGRLWLFKAGIHEATWRKYGIGYSKSLERVVLPVYDDEGNLVWYQCRAVHRGQTPKYIQPSSSREHIMFTAGVTADRTRIIVVEDILSAIRVGKHNASCSLLGTKITTSQAGLLGAYSNVTTWLDGDEAGKRGSYNIRRTLGLICEVSNIVTDKDPKELSDREIKQCLNIQ